MFLRYPANVLSFSHRNNMLYEIFFSISISKNVFDFNQKHFTTNLRDEQCFIAQPSSNMLKALSWDLSIDDVHHLLLQIKVSKWPTMERFMAGRIVVTKGK